MFHVPGIRNTTDGSKLTRCLLAGTVSEKVFKRKFGNHKITEYEIEEYCEEILRVFNDKRVSNRWLFGLHLFSHLMVGVVKLYSYQFLLFENSVFSMVHALDAFDCGILNQSSQRREKNRGAQLAKISQIPIDELLMPLTPELNLDRPFKHDMNLLYELSPASHRRMTELDESDLARFSPLTESQAKLWLSNDEGCLWTNIDTSQFPESERRQSDLEFVHPAAIEAARADLPTRVWRTPTKRTSTQENLGTPSKRQRPSRIAQLDTLDKERTEVAVPAVVPMEQDGEPLPLPVEPMVTEAPEDPMAPIDPVPAIFPMEQDVEPHPLPEHRVAPVNPVPVIFPMEEDVEPQPLPEHQVAPVDQVENATVVERAVQPVKPERRLRYRRKKVKIDAIKTISEVKLKQRENNVQAYTESAGKTRSVPTKKLVRMMLQLPSTIFKFGMENIPRSRLREISDEVLRRHEINICGPFNVETDLSYFRPRDIPRRRTDDALTVLANETDTGKSTENGTVIQPVEVTVAPPDEVPQAEATDEPAFHMAGGAQFPLGVTEQTEHSVNTSDTIIASFKKVQISTDLARSRARSKDQVTVEKSSRSKSRSSEEFIRDNGRELSSPRSGMAANIVWTRKDLEANLEVHWHVNNIISFEQIAPPNETSDADAIACLLLLLNMYKENKVILTQARTDAPIYIGKGVISDVMDWS